MKPPGCWLWVFVLLPTSISGQLACPEALPEITDADVVLLTPSDFVFYCNQPKMIYESGRFQYGACVHGEWRYKRELKCVEGTIPFEGCSTPQPQPRPQEEFQSALMLGNFEAGVPVKCATEYSWLSGSNVRVTECLNDAWTEIYDLCDEECVLPRDCSELAPQEEGLYYISPSKKVMNAMEVQCTKLSCQTGCSLTLVGRKAKPDTYVDLGLSGGGMDQTTPEMGWDTANLPSRTNPYFIGVKALAHMSSEHGEPRPLVVRIEIRLSFIDPPLHITYYNVTFTRDGNVSTSGEFHGDLENCWGHTLDRPSVSPNATECNLFGEMASWGSIDFSSQQNYEVKMFVAPLAVDSDSQCPVLNQIGTFYPHTYVEMSPDRCPGAMLNFTCHGLYFQESTTQQTFGTTTCQDDLTWDPSYQLPCTIQCPEGKVPAYTEDHCIFTPDLSQEPLTNGLQSAIDKCLEVDSFPLWINSSYSLKDVPDDGHFYYTAHVGAEANRVTLLLSGQEIYCHSQVCYGNEQMKCLVVSRNEYRVASCNNETIKVVCRDPAVCPKGYEYHEGSCYKVMGDNDPPTDFPTDMASCGRESAVLAYPESMGDVFYFEQFVRDSGINMPANVKIGIHDVNGDWTLGGLHSPDSDVTDAMAPSDRGYHWRFLNISYEPGDLMKINHENYSTTTAAAICQYPYWESYDCVDSPPNSTLNMYASDWDKVTHSVNTKVTYKCHPGFFLNATYPDDNRTLVCLGLLGGWYSSEPLFDCLPADVCLEDPVPATPNTTKTLTETSRHLNGTVTYTCPDPMAFSGGNRSMNLTCSDVDSVYQFMPDIPECFMFCWNAPEVVNATTDWNETALYIEGSNLTATCNESHELSPGVTEQTINCTSDGTWVSLPCHLACTDPPPEPPFGMDPDTSGENEVGTILNYTCQEGRFIPPTEEFPVLTPVAQVVCSSNGTWIPPDSFDCDILCPEDPLIADGVVNNWNGFQRALTTEVEYRCEQENQIFTDGTGTKLLTCAQSEWKGIEQAELECVTGTVDNPVVPASSETSASLDAPDPPYFEGEQTNYTCDPGKRDSQGRTYITLTYTADGWTGFDPDFICYDETYDPPPLPIATAGQQGSLEGFPEAPYHVSDTFDYVCPPGSTGPNGEDRYTLTFTENGWEELPPDFICYNVTYLPPALPAEAYGGGYLTGDDAPYHVGSVLYYHCHENYVTDLETMTAEPIPITYTANGWTELDVESLCLRNPNAPPPPTTTETPLEMFDKNVFDEAYEITSDNHMPSIENFMGTVNGPEYVLTDGPFGFGYAIRLNTPEQCMKRSPYATPDDCTSDPKTCTKGFTIGIWERVNISFNVFYTVHKYPEDRKRYILSTGGDEFGHPGIALYHQGLAIIGLVSTGDEYWQVDVLGNFDVNEWYHIALRFIASVGLEMFKDGKKVGHCHMSKNSAPRLALLNPSELLVGCHRDADNTNYRDYNNADFDEFATWNRRLPDSELSYLRGGNEEKVENLSPEECAHMLSKTDLKDSKQADIAMNMLNAMADTIPVVEESDNTTDTVKYNGTVKPLDAAGLKLKGIADVIHEVTKPKVIRDTYTVEDLDTYFKVVETASKILDESYAEQWHAIEESGHRGARGVKEDMERYVDIIASRIPLDKKNPQPMSYIKTTDNIMVKIEKMSIKDFREIGGTYATPDYREDGMEDLYREWDLPFDKVKVPTDLFSDPRCQMHPVSIVTCFYDSYDDVQSSEVISDQITPEGGLELGSRVLRVNISIDKPLHRKGHPKYYECHFDPKKVDKARIRFNLENKLKMPQLRALSFHHNELQTPVKQRLCIWWNTVINGWDTAGCKVLDTTSLNTKCVCRHWGTVATLVEFVEEKYPPYESDTAKYVKLFLYIISDICLLIYILVVFLAGDLKDQFHISGAALSVSVIGGSTALLISDSENIQSDRHNCAAMGTLIQGFYLMSGGWVAMLGHAGFKAVSKGIITGRLKSYCLISSGIALAVVGVSYAFYIHDMGTDPRCFIAWDDNLKLILFFCPLMCFLCVGVFFACVIFFNIRHAKKLNKAIETDLSSFILGSTYVMIYYFIVWVVGILSYIHFDGEYLGCYPTFQILNSLVGVVILLSLGIHSLKFRRVLTAASKRRGEMLQKMKETANKAKPKALNKPKGNNAKAPPAKAPPPSKPSTNPPPTQPPANPPPPQAPPKPPTPAPPAKPPTPQPPADLCPPAENPSQQAADLLDL